MEAGAGFRLCGGVFPTPGDVVTLAAPATRARIVNVFVDNSNLHQGSAWNPVNLERVVQLVERGRFCSRRFVAGVMTEFQKMSWQRLGYTVKTGIKDDAVSNIDEVLHAHILDCIVCDGMEKPPGVIALVTGDGNDNNAIRMGWKIEIYSWPALLSDCYKRMAEVHRDWVTIYDLTLWAVKAWDKGETGASSKSRKKKKKRKRPFKRDGEDS